MDHLPARLLGIGLAIAFILAVGTVGFTLIEHYPVFDAFYMTLTTITTVGYTELHPLSHAGRIFNSFLIFFGVTIMFLAVGAMTQTVIELELNQFFGKRRIKNMIDKMRDHYIVCGYGRVGRGAAEELRRSGVPFLVVDRDDDNVERAIKNGMVAVVADATRDETLREVGIERAKGLIATLATDADNLFVILSAKNLNPRLQLSARVSEEEAEQKLRHAGADFVYAPYNITGHRIAQALLRPHVSRFIDSTTKDMGLDANIEQVRVPDAGFAPQSLEKMQVRRETGVIVLAIRKADGRMLFNPPAEAEVASGDFLIVMGEAESLAKLERRLAEVQA